MLAFHVSLNGNYVEHMSNAELTCHFHIECWQHFRGRGLYHGDIHFSHQVQPILAGIKRLTLYIVKWTFQLRAMLHRKYGVTVFHTVVTLELAKESVYCKLTHYALQKLA